MHFDENFENLNLNVNQIVQILITLHYMVKCESHNHQLMVL